MLDDISVATVLQYLTFVHHKPLQRRDSGPQSLVIKVSISFDGTTGVTGAYRFSASGNTKPSKILSQRCHDIEQ